MPIVALDAIEEVGVKFIGRLGDELQAKIDTLGEQLTRSEQKNVDSLTSLLDDSKLGILARLAVVLNGATESCVASLTSLLDGPDNPVARGDAVAAARLGEFDDRLKGRLAQSDEQLAGRIAEFKQAADAGLAQFNQAADARLAQFNTDLTQRIGQFREDVLNPAFRRTEELVEECRRKFVRATLLLLTFAGFLVLAMTFDTAGGARSVRLGLFLVFLVAAGLIFFSDAALDALTGARRHKR